jgi:hypothetical protein
VRTPAQFVEVVRRTISKPSPQICILYSNPVYDIDADPNKIWPEMNDESFRTIVSAFLPKGHFSPPDELDNDWMFRHYPSI